MSGYDPDDMPSIALAELDSGPRLRDIVLSLRRGQVPQGTRTRLEGARNGSLPWMATLTAAELMIVRSHGLRPISAISATCWLHYGWSWTQGHAQGWGMALERLREEARAAGANAVLDVKMRTIPLAVENSMDFTLSGTAVWVEGLPPSNDPIIATVPALEFVKLLEADVVPTGIAVGAQYDWLSGWIGNVPPQGWMNNLLAGNAEMQSLGAFWEGIRRRAHAELRSNARSQGNGVLAHLNFSQLFEFENNNQGRFLGRHIVVATTVDARRGNPLPHNIRMVVDMRAGPSPLTRSRPHHQAYGMNETEGAI